MASGSEVTPMAPPTSTPLTERDLIQGCLLGDERAWTELYQRFHPHVLRITSWPRWRLSQTEAEDCAQDVFVDLARSLRAFRGDASLATFMSRLARNRCVSLIRRKTALKRGKEVTGYVFEQRRDAEEPLALAVSSLPGPEEVLLSSDDSEAMRRWFMVLGDDCRAILNLRYYEDLAYDEICTRLALPLGTVCSRIKRCLDRLRKIVRG